MPIPTPPAAFAVGGTTAAVGAAESGLCPSGAASGPAGACGIASSRIPPIGGTDPAAALPVTTPRPNSLLMLARVVPLVGARKPPPAFPRLGTPLLPPRSPCRGPALPLPRLPKGETAPLVPALTDDGGEVEIDGGIGGRGARGVGCHLRGWLSETGRSRG